MHDEIIKDIKYDKKNNVLKMVLEFCEWQLEELNEKYKGLELTFNDVEQVLSYTDLNQLIKDNSIWRYIKHLFFWK